MADFSAETLKARKLWSDIFHATKVQTKATMSSKLSLKIDGEVNFFQNKHKTSNSCSLSQHCNILKGILHLAEEESYSQS
jgi:hypothetical protein